MEIFERRELKYFVPKTQLDELRRKFLENMEYDPFCRKGVLYSPYTVRSIYLDTQNFLFYYEKIDGLEVRKKLRIRTYNTPESSDEAFLEIKRKFNNIVYKERVKTRFPETPLLFNGSLPKLKDKDPSFLSKSALKKFAFLINQLNLTPKVLITYEREALYAIDDPKVRVTFDINVRSFAFPDLDDMYREQDLMTINDDCFILEIKFNGHMPVWIRQIVRELNLRVQAISKYCRGLDAWPSFAGRIAG